MKGNQNAVLTTHGTQHASDLPARAAVVIDVAAKHAASVDAESRFPAEAFAAIREQRLLGIMVPRALGGEDADFSAVADVCYRLGQACAATAMIYAMHQVKVACLVRNGMDDPAIRELLARLAKEELLLASSTTEGIAGGNVRASEAPVIVNGERFTLERRATCISYGEAADGIVTTARRTPDSPASDQVLVAVLKEDYTLTPTHTWDTFGMRGTCSEGYLLKVDARKGHILSQPYDRIHAESMVPAAHLFWGSAWAGIAASATSRAQGFIRHAMRNGNGALPPGAAHLTVAQAKLRTVRGLLMSMLSHFERIKDDSKALNSLDFQTSIAMTKIEVSELAVAIVLETLRDTGLSGYRNDNEFSVCRQLRDVLSSPIMIHNDRVLANLSTPALMAPVPHGLGG